MAFLWLLSCLLFFSEALGCGDPDIYPVISGFARIMNGEEAVPGSWPWQVSLQEKNGWHACGGSLISARWVVTSISCAVTKSHLVVLGEHDKGNSSEAIKTVAVAEVFSHPDWNPQTKEFDIALIKLATPVGFTKTVAPVCVPQQDEEYTGFELCVTTGWGLIRNNAFFAPNKLHQAAVPLLTNLQCETYYGDVIFDSMICAGGAGSSACAGDTGGPLVCDKYGSWYLVGLSSWGSSDCSSSMPAVYSRISSLRQWMDLIITMN